VTLQRRLAVPEMGRLTRKMGRESRKKTPWNAGAAQKSLRALSLHYCTGILIYTAIWFAFSSDGSFITESVIQQS
jgi:hypothetical protein